MRNELLQARLPCKYYLATPLHSAIDVAPLSPTAQASHSPGGTVAYIYHRKSFRRLPSLKPPPDDIYCELLLLCDTQADLRPIQSDAPTQRQASAHILKHNAVAFTSHPL